MLDKQVGYLECAGWPSKALHHNSSLAIEGSEPLPQLQDATHQVPGSVDADDSDDEPPPLLEPVEPGDFDPEPLRVLSLFCATSDAGTLAV